MSSISRACLIVIQCKVHQNINYVTVTVTSTFETLDESKLRSVWLIRMIPFLERSSCEKSPILKSKILSSKSTVWLELFKYLSIHLPSLQNETHFQRTKFFCRIHVTPKDKNLISITTEEKNNPFLERLRPFSEQNVRTVSASWRILKKNIRVLVPFQLRISKSHLTTKQIKLKG